MWKTNIKQALRYIISQKKFSLVIIIGLSVGLAASFLVYSYVFYEKNYDNFHEKGNNLYRIVVTSQQEGRDPYKSPYSYAPQGEVAVDEIPEVEKYVRLGIWPNMVITSSNDNEKTIITEDNYYYADDSFFELFTFPLLQGDPKNVLKESGTVVISQTMAKKLYGSQNSVGKTLTVDGKYTIRVTGVFEDIPENTHLKFNMLFSLNTFPWIMNPRNAWNNHSFFTYLLLKEGADPNLVEKKITEAYLKENRAVNQSECNWELQPVNEAYLNTSDFTSKPDSFKFGDERIVYFLSLIAFLILCIAWVNYINLSTAKAAERGTEIMVRKTNGAGKKQLISHFFVETILFNLISIVIAILLVASIFDWFKASMSFNFSLWNQTGFWIVIGSVIIFGILLSGCLSAFHATKLTSTILSAKSNFSYRNGLVIFQFIIIITLMVGVIAVNKQLNYLHNVDLGFQKKQVLVLNAPRVDVNLKDDNKLTIFKEELTKHSNIKDITASVSIPGERFGSGNGGPYIKGETNRNTYFRVGRVMPNYLDFYKIKLVSGRNFGNNMISAKKSIIINEEAVKEFGFENADDAIGSQAIWNNNEATIIGVTHSFHQQSLHITPDPMIMYTMQFETDINYILVKLNVDNLEQSLSAIESKFNSIFPNNPIDYFFLDNFFDQQYKKDIAFQKLFSFFSIVALLIGFFGLYGLTTFRIIKKTKEIGIRKVNGAKTKDVMIMLNRDFVKWVIIAFIIASPIAWYAMNSWLNNFAYKTELSWWIFALAGIFAMGITLLTVSWQSWRAAKRNPVESLRYE